MCDCPIYFALDMKKRLIGIIVVGAMALLMGCSGDGYAKEVLQKLPMEFAVEAQKLLSVSLEGTVG